MSQNDGALASLLVSNVGDIEAAVQYIQGKIDPVLWRESGNVLESASESWGGTGEFHTDDDSDPWIMPADWKTEPSFDMGYEEDAWFGFGTNKDDADDMATSLSWFLGVTPEGDTLMLYFGQQMLKGRKWKNVLAQQEQALQSIRDAGFRVELREGSIEMPVRLDAALLSSALADEDVGAALDPLRNALQAAYDAKPYFDILVKAARDVAYA